MKKLTILVFVMIAVLLFSASMVDAVTARFISRQLPGQVVAWNHYIIAAEILYDSHVGPTPVPSWWGTFGIEVERNLFARPVYLSGSFPSMDFSPKTGTITGRWVWETHHTFFFIGITTREARVTAQATWPPGTGQAFIGTTRRDGINARYFSNVTLVP